MLENMVWDVELWVEIGDMDGLERGSSVNSIPVAV
jgi:hypothetical protein